MAVPSLSRIVLVQLVVVVGCGPGTDPPTAGTTEFAEATETGSSGAVTDDAASTSTTEASDPGESSGSTSGVGTTTDGGSTGEPACDPIVPGEFNACWDGNATHTEDCNWTGTSYAVGFPGCLIAAGIRDGNVCMITGCEDRCDCFAQPTTGTARVECMEGIIADDTACVLYCRDGQICPDGMVCGFNICAWELQ